MDEDDPELIAMQFALTNSVRCRPVNEQAKSASGTSWEMVEECSGHTRKVVEALSPDIIISQGQKPNWSIDLLYKPEHVYELKDDRVQKRARRATIGSDAERLYLLSSHPANH